MSKIFQPVIGATVGLLQVVSDEDSSVLRTVGSMDVVDAFLYVTSHDLPSNEAWWFVANGISYAWDDEDGPWGQFVGYEDGYDGPTVSSDQSSPEDRALFDAHMATESWLCFDGHTVATRGPWSSVD